MTTEVVEVKVGSYLLETLTTGMYENGFHCIREYVQNAFDGINDAIAAGNVLPGEGRITISITGHAQRPSLSVRDNGSGVAVADVADRLISIGNSSKNPRKHAGFRGIGRLAGIAYCSLLRFKTSVAGESVASIVEFDCSKARGLMAAGAVPRPLQKIILDCISIRQEREQTGAHYMLVEMVRLNGMGLEFADKEELERYLSQQCPVEYLSAFPYATKIEAAAARFKTAIPTVAIELKHRRDSSFVRKPYLKTIITRNDRPGKEDTKSILRDIETFGSEEHGWFGWIGITDFPGKIKDDKISGIRFRQKNIKIGDSSILEHIAGRTQAPTNRALLSWVVGEMFVFDPKVVPNARRDGFEDSPEWRAIERDMQEVIKVIVKHVRTTSTRRNKLTKIDRIVRDAKNKADSAEDGKLSKQSIETLDAQLDKQLQDISKALQKGADPEGSAKLVSEIKELREKLKKMPVKEPELAPQWAESLREIKQILTDELTPAVARRIYGRIEKVLLPLSKQG
jgi:molecular chaperone HtpG